MPKGVHDKHPIGEAHGMAVLNNEQVLYIKKAWRDCPRDLLHGLIQILADKFGVSIMPVQQVCHGDTWRHIAIDEEREHCDPELLELIHERRKANMLARKAQRIYTKGEKKCRNEYVDTAAPAKRKQAIRRSRTKKRS